MHLLYTQMLYLDNLFFVYAFYHDMFGPEVLIISNAARSYKLQMALKAFLKAIM